MIMSVVAEGAGTGPDTGEDEPRVSWLGRQWRQRPASIVVIVIVVGITLCVGGHYVLRSDSNGPKQVQATSGRYAYTAPAGWDVSPVCSYSVMRYDDLSCAAPPGESDNGVAVISTITSAMTDQELVAWATDQARKLSDYNLCGISTSTANDVRSAIICLVGRFGAGSRSSLRVKARGRVAVLEYCFELEFSGISAGCDYIWSHLEVTATN